MPAHPAAVHRPAEDGRPAVSSAETPPRHPLPHPCLMSREAYARRLPSKSASRSRREPPAPGRSTCGPDTPACHGRRAAFCSPRPSPRRRGARKTSRPRTVPPRGGRPPVGCPATRPPPPRATPPRPPRPLVRPGASPPLLPHSEPNRQTAVTRACGTSAASSPAVRRDRPSGRPHQLWGFAANRLTW
jgi:hypothetical protein